MAQWSNTGLPTQLVEIQLTSEMVQTFLMTFGSTQHVLYEDFRLLEMSSLLLVFRVFTQILRYLSQKEDIDSTI